MKEYILIECSEEIVEKNKIANDFNEIASDFNDSEKIFKDIDNCVTFFGSARIQQDNRFCKLAEKLAFNLNKKGINIVTGGGGGIMEAANRGAYDANTAESIGLNIIIPVEQKLNLYTTRSHTFNYFFSRKYMLVKHSSACVVFPGGYGTLDELFEIIILVQTQKIENLKIYLYDTEFWKNMLIFLEGTLVKENMISIDELDILTLSDDIEFIEKDILKLFNKN
ncbi:TIGR00730 family Rossman fold protein [uncultured Arcobacter sp.]|uniref:LOG family protein n=1 Tax=uncultured Arcobacter sp. TaxID=165434 RepID=UPI00263482FE|nr:TIGR00730 family Rossman fold protein [uncultured Arcobacter sp.]